MTKSKKWQCIALGDCAVINARTYSPKEAWPNISYLDTGSITDNFISKFQLIADLNELPSRARRKVYTGDIVYSTVRPNMRHFGILKSIPKNLLVSTGFAVIRGIDELAHTDYIYLVLTQKEIIEYLQTLAEQNTSAYPSIRPIDLANLEILLPPFNEQKCIASMLSIFNDKIGLNRRINKTLEEMARALFKSWFVNFDPVRAKMDGRWQPGQSLPGLPSELYDLFPDRLVPSEIGKIPEGWKVTKLGNLVETIRGRSYRSKELSDSDTALVTLKSFARGGGYRLDGLKPYIGKYKEQQIVHPGELIVAMTDVTQAAEVVGRPAIVQESKYSTLVVSLDCTIVRPRDDTYLSIPYLYYMAMTRSFNEHTYALTTGTTVLHLSREAVPSFLLPLPPKSIVEYFNKLSIPIFKRIANNISESETLATIRESLLPKLLSGEIRVDDLENLPE